MSSSSRLIMPLIRAHYEADADKFTQLAESVAAESELAGKRVMAQDIRTLISSQGVDAPVRLDLSPDLEKLVHVTQPTISLDDLVLEPSIAERLAGLVREQREKDALAKYGLTPRRKLLMSGPPGTGKSMSARALAGTLKMPLFSVRLDGIINKHLGESAQNLRKIFDAMQEYRGVWFFDEIDALASDRGNAHDIGEARRILNSLLTMIEQDRSPGLLVGATNFRSLIDKAIFRRFDLGITYGRPGAQDIREILKRQLHRFETQGFVWDEVISAAAELSHADVTEAAIDAARSAVLDRGGKITEEDLLVSIRDRHQLRDVVDAV